MTLTFMTGLMNTCTPVGYIEPAYISSVLTDDLNFIMKVDAEHIATMLFPVRRYCIKSCVSFLGDTLRDI